MTVSKPQLGEMVQRKARQLDAVVVSTLQEHVRGDHCVQVQVFDALMQGRGHRI